MSSNTGVRPWYEAIFGAACGQLGRKADALILSFDSKATARIILGLQLEGAYGIPRYSDTWGAYGGVIQGSLPPREFSMPLCPMRQGPAVTRTTNLETDQVLVLGALGMSVLSKRKN